MDTVLAGVAPVDFYDNNHNLYATAMALTDAGLNVSVSEDVARGGESNARITSYFYDSNLALTLTSTTFALEYLATKLGSVIESGGDVFTTETVTTTLNTITVTGTPVAPFADSTTKYGWYKLPNASTWTTITFTGSVASTTIEAGTEVCVRYAYTDAGARKFKVSSSIIPDISYAVMRVPMLKSGTAMESYTSASKVGELLVKIPKFQFDPNTDLAISSSGHASVALGGNALINYTGGCSSTGWYAEIVEQIFGREEFDNVSAIVVEDSDLELTVSDTQTLKVLKMYNDGRLPSVVDNSLLTFISLTPATATVGAHTGLVTAIGAGTSSIQISVTTKPTLEASAYVTVTA